MNNVKKINGFTLLEILIAMFVFTIVSTILLTGLHTIINTQSGAENNAEQIRHLQMSLLKLSKDIEQTVNRPILDATGKQEAAFIGASTGFTFTHVGLANSMSALRRSTLQRIRYLWDKDTVWRITWPVLDQAGASQPHLTPLLQEVSDARFQYLDKNGQFQNKWPPDEGGSQYPLPLAVKVTLTLKMGKLSQLYVIPVQSTNINRANSAQ